MTNHHARLYGLALALVVFFLGWATVAAHPWATTTADPRLRALALREAQLRREAQVVRHVVAARWAHYRVQLKLRQAQIANVSAAATASVVQQTVTAAPVQVVTLPAHVITRTS